MTLKINRQAETQMPSYAHIDVDLLVLGAGWTFSFLRVLLDKRNISYARTTRNGRDGSIRWVYDDSMHDGAKLGLFEKLPRAKVVLLTFPVRDIEWFTRFYEATHPPRDRPKKRRKNLKNAKEEGDSLATLSSPSFIMLGSTAIWKPDTKGIRPVPWSNEESEWDEDNVRGTAEYDFLHHLGRRGYVLNLAGLYGGDREPKRWLPRVMGSQEQLAGKGSVHLIHGHDVARAILYCFDEAVYGPRTTTAPAPQTPTSSSSSDSLCYERPHASTMTPLSGRRWILTDLHVYDWWELAAEWGAEVRQKLIEEGHESAKELQWETWVRETMLDHEVPAIPRPTTSFARRIDGRAFWAAVESMPEIARVT